MRNKNNVVLKSKDGIQNVTSLGISLLQQMRNNTYYFICTKLNVTRLLLILKFKNASFISAILQLEILTILWQLGFD